MSEQRFTEHDISPQLQAIYNEAESFVETLYDGKPDDWEAPPMFFLAVPAGPDEEAKTAVCVCPPGENQGGFIRIITMYMKAKGIVNYAAVVESWLSKIKFSGAVGEGVSLSKADRDEAVQILAADDTGANIYNHRVIKRFWQSPKLGPLVNMPAAYSDSPLLGLTKDTPDMPPEVVDEVIRMFEKMKVDPDKLEKDLVN